MEGKSTKAIKDQEIYKDVDACIDHVKYSLSKKEVTLKFVVNIQKHLEGTKNLLACRGLSKAETEQKIEEYNVKYEAEKKRLACVLSVVNVLKGKAHLPKIDILEDEIMQVKSDLEALKFTCKEMQSNKGIWGKLVTLPKLCKEVEPVVSSHVFWKVSAMHIVEVYSRCVYYERYENESLVEEDIRFLFGECLHPLNQSVDSEDSNKITICETSEEGLILLEAVKDEGVSKYRDFWQKLNVCEDLDVNFVAMHLDSVDVAEEIKQAEDYFKIRFGKERKEALVRIGKRKHQAKTTDTVKNTLKAINMYCCIDKELLHLLESSNEILVGSLRGIPFSKVNTSLQTLFQVTENLSEDTISILDALSKSSNFIKFLISTIKEDFTNLIDAVEDISEQQVDVSTVSSLIEIQRYMHPVLLYVLGGENNAFEFLRKLEKQTEVQGKNAKNLPLKIQDCAVKVHNLNTLTKSVANRGEKTKEVISSIVKQGKFHFHIDSNKDQVVFEISYIPKGLRKTARDDSKKVRRRLTKQESALTDLRSSALLLMNSEKSSIHSNVNKEELTSFVDTFDNCCSIRDTLQELYSSGHIKYVQIDSTLDGKCLQETKNNILIDYQQWTSELQQERSQNYLLNFVRGFEIQTLIKYFESGVENADVLLLCKYIHPSLQPKQTHNAFKGIENNEISMLAKIGRALDVAHRKERLSLFERPTTNIHPNRFLDIVCPGRLLIAKLKEDSLCVIQTVLTLYVNTTRCLPEASQIIFCSPTTKWSDVQLLINRCLGSYAFYGKMPLYCLAHVEMLPNALQFRLVSALQTLPERAKFLFAVVCRGTKYHPFIAELKQHVTSIQCLSDQIIREIIATTFPSVCYFVSEIAGLGKTTEIYRLGRSMIPPRKVQTLHISDPFKKENMLKQLINLHLDNESLLHIDIFVTKNMNDVDIFLFELILLRFANIDKNSTFLENDCVALEISNTINDALRNSLQLLLFFNRKSLKWKEFQNFVISYELNSPVQVVCQHLNLLEEGKFDLEELHFTGKHRIKPLPDTKCKSLLKRYLNTDSDLSFSVVHTFLSMLADQLKKMSNSVFFKPSNICQMIKYEAVPTVRSTLLKEMIEVSLDFAFRSIRACKNTQAATIDRFSTNESEVRCANEIDIVHRTKTMIRWEESNHLIFVFHEQNPQTLTPMYRLKEHVPKHIRSLFEVQIKRPLDDFSQLNQNKLQNILEKVVKKRQHMAGQGSMIQEDSVESSEVDNHGYALTPDNLLKMILIKMRIKSRVPVVVMGETGCGKTSLIRYLAGVCNITLEVINIHAGVHEDTIVNKVQELNAKCKMTLEKEIWLFFDEINTSESLGLMCDVLCHHRCFGELLSPNLVVMAACNPYKLRSENEILTAGLEGKAKIDDLSKLVYRVLPLPETMVDFVWDFGTLSQADEQKYIKRMLTGVFAEGNQIELFCDLVMASQEFIRAMKSSCVVSLRDVHRCKILVKWFQNVYLKNREIPKKAEYGKNIVGMILSLAHCYHSRFQKKETRTQYRKCLAQIFFSHKLFSLSEKKILQIIKDEQRWIIDTMDLPLGTAKNSPLQENVFLLLVCILNKIPIFIVGKPGCSKSLAMQIVRSNLRGKDSRHTFLQSLQQLLCVSFQGSKSSTSEGITQVFEKAEAYQNVNLEGDVLSVVLIDEIGLAENSRFNPLKVLHSLLEPEGKSYPNVAVVGISNWALDASKMNRAVHLSRPDMDIDELIETGISISESFTVKVDCLTTNYIKKDLEHIAKAYANYSTKLRFRNFHGLRDYYALVKYVASNFSETSRNAYAMKTSLIIQRGLERNFGGLPDERKLLYDSFASVICGKSLKITPVIELIKENLNDPLARHLMIITKGDSIISFVEREVKKRQLENPEHKKCKLEEHEHTKCQLEEPEHKQRQLEMPDHKKCQFEDPEHKTCQLEGSEHTKCQLEEPEHEKRQLEVPEHKICQWEQITGSNFPEDKTDDYNYRILSRIILCMEQGVVLVLKNLESVYGSLYDMLNQNYTVVNQRKTCRVALGAYSNPYCEVANTFRCIVIVDSTKVDYTDPPFLNRFEKQFLSYADILSSQQKKMVNDLEEWIDHVSAVKTDEFDKFDVFPNYNSELISSLVLRVCEDSLDSDSALDICKQKLFWIMKPEAVVRLSRCKFQPIRDNSNGLIEMYFKLPIHDGIKHLFEHQKKEIAKTAFQRTIVFTNSNIHTSATKTISENKTQCEKIGSFKSEKQLSLQIENFCKDPNMEVLCIQCTSCDDKKHILLTKSILDHYLTIYEQMEFAVPKFVYMIIHLEKHYSSSFSLTQINYLSEWELIMMDCLEIPDVSLSTLYSKTLLETINHRGPLREFIKGELFWGFSRIKYRSKGRTYDGIVAVMQYMQSQDFLDIFEKRIRIELNTKYEHTDRDQEWAVDIACNQQTLYTSASYLQALNKHVQTAIKIPLAKILFKLEVTGALDCLCIKDEHSKQRIEVWEKLFLDKTFVSVEDIEDESGPECYVCETQDFKLELPFSRLIFVKIEETRDEFINAFMNQKADPENLDERDELKDEVFGDLLLQQECIVLRLLSNVPFDEFSDLTQLYLNDFYNQVSCNTCFSFEKEERIKYLEWALLQKTVSQQCHPIQMFCRIHCVYWQHAALFSSVMHLLETCKDIFRGDVDILLDRLPKTNSGISSDFAEIKTISSSFPETTETTHLKCTLGNMSTLSRSEEVLCLKQNDDLTSVRASKSHSLEDLSSNCRLVMRMNTLHFDEVDKSVDHDLSQEHLFKENPQQANRSPLITEDVSPRIPDHVIGEDDWDSFEYLVDNVCRQMLPTKTISTRLGGVEAWQRQTHVLLTVAADISRIPRMLHALRFCNDLAAGLILPMSLSEVFLEDIADSILLSGLTSVEVYQNVIKMFKSGLPPNDMKRCYRILSNFLERCFDYEPGANAYNLMFDLVVDGTFSDTGSEQLKTPLFLLLDHELSLDKHVGFALLNSDHSANKMTKRTIFTAIDTFLVNMARRSQCGHQIVLLLVDLFQNVIYGREANEGNDDCNYLLLSGTIIQSHSFGLKYLLAVAYVKSRLTTESANENLCSVSLLQDLDVLLQGLTENIKRQTIITFFFKLLGSNKLFSAIHKTCKQIQGDCTLLKSIQWTSNYALECIETNPLAVYVPMCTVQASKLIVFENESTMAKNMADLWSLIDKSESGVLLPYQLLVNKFYFPRYQRKQTETDSVLADYFLEKIAPKYDRESQEFFSYIVGKQDFVCNELRPSEGRTAQHYFLSSVLITIYALTLANNKKSDPKTLLGKCLLTPNDIVTTFLPAFPDPEESSEGRPNQVNTKASTISLNNCMCGQRIAYIDTGESHKCPVCGNSFDHAQNAEIFAVLSTEIQMIAASLLQCSTDGKTSAVSRNIVFILVKGCFYGSLALGFIQKDETQTSDTNPLKLNELNLWEELSEHWLNLIKLLNFTDYQLGVYLHSVIFVMQDLLFKNLNPIACLLDKKHWETEFEKIMQRCIDQKIAMISDHIGRCDAIYGYHDTIEQNIRETTKDTPNIVQLFRKTTNFSKSDFCTQLFYQSSGLPFLKLLLQYESRLKLPKHAYAIVQWHFAALTALGYSYRTDDCNGIKVNEFEKQIKDIHTQKLFCKRFKAFVNTWKDLVESQEFTEDMPYLKHINRQTELSKCLIIDEKSIVYQVLSKLVSIQNDFLDTSLFLAENCENLNFLIKTKHRVSIKCVRVAEISMEVLIGTNDLEFELENVFAFSSQSCLKYGYGQQVIYDFNRIERELVQIFLVNKSYIDMDSLPKIQFFDNFYKNFSSLLHDVRNRVKQLPLPLELLEQLKQSNETSMPSELITHTGLLLTLLKKMQCNPDELLVDFVQARKSILGKTFPVDCLPIPKIRLCHTIALHETLEELCAENVTDTLEKEFHNEIDEELKLTLATLPVSNMNLALVVLKTLKLFVYRCLSLRRANADQRLAKFLQDDSFWPESYIKDGVFQTCGEKYLFNDVFPDRILVGQTRAVLYCLEDSIQREKQKGKKSKDTKENNPEDRRQAIHRQVRRT